MRNTSLLFVALLSVAGSGYAMQPENNNNQQDDQVQIVNENNDQNDGQLNNDENDLFENDEQPNNNEEVNNAPQGFLANIRSGLGYVRQYANTVKDYLAEHPGDSVATAVGAVSLGILSEGAYKAYQNEFENGLSTQQKVKYGLALAGACGSGYYTLHRFEVAPHHGAQALYARFATTE